MKINYKLPLTLIASIACMNAVTAFAQDEIEIQRTHHNGEVRVEHEGDAHLSGASVEITHGERYHHRDRVLRVSVGRSHRHWVPGHDAIRHGEEVWIPGHYVRSY